MLDTARRIATPEGIELTLRLAGPVPRALAWVFDLVIRAGVLFAVMTIAASLQKFGLALLLLTAFLLEWLYPAAFEALWSGMTPGKRLLGIMVLNDDGTPVRWPGALTRNLLRAADFLPALYFVGFVAMVMNRDFKRLGDLAANTLVVYREEKPRPAAVPEDQPTPPAVALTVSEQRAVLDFAEREKQELRDQDVKLQVIGELDELPINTRHAVESATQYTAGCRGMTLSLALSYGGRADILNAARAIAIRAATGSLLPEEINEETFQSHMSTHALPAVDLLIRTGGERRVSDFLLFEAAYAELVFLPIMWPEFTSESLLGAIDVYLGKERRFGLTSEQIQGASRSEPASSRDSVQLSREAV